MKITCHKDFVYFNFVFLSGRLRVLGVFYNPQSQPTHIAETIVNYMLIVEMKDLCSLRLMTTVCILILQFSASII